MRQAKRQRRDQDRLDSWRERTVHEMIGAGGLRAILSSGDQTFAWFDPPWPMTDEEKWAVLNAPRPKLRYEERFEQSFAERTWDESIEWVVDEKGFSRAVEKRTPKQRAWLIRYPRAIGARVRGLSREVA